MSTGLTHEDRYKILIEARNFHYNNFSKWLTYFYVAIGAIFIGYCTLLSSEREIKDIETLEIMILILGYIVSIFWYLSAKGYYHWNINFISLVNHYEQNLLKYPNEHRVYFVHANKNRENNYWCPASGANISTSKIAILFAFIISLFWGILLAKTLFWESLSECVSCNWIIWILLIIGSIISTLLISYKLGRKLKSYIKIFPDLNLNFNEIPDNETR